MCSHTLKRPGLSERALYAEWRGVTLVKREGERPIRSAARRAFTRQERDVLDRLESLSRTLAFDLDAWTRGMNDDLSPAMLNAIRRGFETGAERIGLIEADVFDPNNLRVRLTLRAMLDKTVGISETTADRLTRTLLEGTSAAESLEALAARVRAVFADATVRRSRTIAQTASTTATEAGQAYAFAEAGVERRRWLSARLPTTRPAHDDADGQEVGVDEPFEVMGEMLDFPGDPAGAAENTINCYCTVLPLL